MVNLKEIKDEYLRTWKIQKSGFNIFFGEQVLQSKTCLDTDVAENLVSSYLHLIDLKKCI